MPTSTDVRLWKTETYEGVNVTTYTVIWVVAGDKKRSPHRSAALAETFRSELLTAMRKGEVFDVETGLPVSMLREREATVPTLTWYTFACSYMEMKWPAAAAKTRAAIADALATATPALVQETSGRPDSKVLRAGLMGWAFNPSRREVPVTDAVAQALAWLERNSLPLSLFADSQQRPIRTRQALDAIALRMDGRAAAASTARRKRAVLYNAFGHAVELGHLPANPIDTVQWRNPKTAEEVDRRVVPSPAQVRELLTVVTYAGRTVGPRLRAFFALLYFAALRPSEALALRKQDCHLPTSGWGSITLVESLPESGRAWTDDGARTEKRSLKWRGRREVRRVPIPPELVIILRDHLDAYGSGRDGRLFRTATGGRYANTAYYRAWETARRLGFPPHLVDSPLAARPYDLRHGGVTLWLNAGVPAPEVARRAGHGVDVLLKIYAGCIDGEEDVANQRIETALSLRKPH